MDDVGLHVQYSTSGMYKGGRVTYLENVVVVVVAGPDVAELGAG